MRANMVVVVCMGIAALAGLIGFLVARNWTLLTLGGLGVVGCVSALLARRKMSAAGPAPGTGAGPS